MATHSNTSMPQAPLPCCKYSYIHHDQKGLSQAIDIHDISIAKNRVRVLISYLGALLFLAGSFYLLLMKEKLDMHSIWSIFLVFVLAIFLQYKPIKKESVVIMPGFAVQLETHYWSGRIARRFVPIDKILRPVLNECVTPVTCCWSLALILRGEEELMLVFKDEAVILVKSDHKEIKKLLILAHTLVLFLVNAEQYLEARNFALQTLSLARSRNIFTFVMNIKSYIECAELSTELELFIELCNSKLKQNKLS